MFSKPLLGTNKNKNKLSWIEYIWVSCILQGWQNCIISFKHWVDLISGNLDNYILLKDDDPLECCLMYFWDSLEDDIYSKEFLEYLLKLSDDVESGKVKTVPFTKDMFDKIDDLIGEK